MGPSRVGFSDWARARSAPSRVAAEVVEAEEGANEEGNGDDGVHRCVTWIERFYMCGMRSYIHVVIHRRTKSE